MGSLRHSVTSHFRERDNGESKTNLDSEWNPDHEEEAIVPTICTWANGAIEVERAVIFKYDNSDHEETHKKAGPKSTTSFTKKKGSLQNTLTKKFKEFKPVPVHIEDEIRLHPKLEIEMQKEQENIKANVSSSALTYPMLQKSRF